MFRKLPAMKHTTFLMTIIFILSAVICVTNCKAYTEDDFDLDTVPDINDLYPFDFNNDGIYDAHTLEDFDADGIRDYPYGKDMWLNTTTTGIYIGGFSSPQPTANLTAESRVGSIEISWERVLGTDVLGYNVYKSAESGCNYSKINDEVITNTTFTDENVIESVTYYYVVKTVNQTGFESRQSMEISATRSPYSALPYSLIFGIVIVVLAVILFVYKMKRRKVESESSPHPQEKQK
ncbi:MAG: hypothetical protein KKH41_04190 [Candidatus Thermoplasmatota archaeon]|nr:hypothetical protein [Euryarchaeota archaeon]MBU4031498.1 hypothetical protein [Candidatus Thermoplasmatota archaeon]MBU4070881.1 hypothetical protein [Candidatus Thermoplasmatota archaeon]MBU4143581.1 hypothetical protein [Candidatus Thermoplasmatota archaeon]MBU4591768.1 hypothetical protein [Candidatus Thermoplasmatota archaeon]